MSCIRKEKGDNYKDTEINKIVRGYYAQNILNLDERGKFLQK